jgi:glycosyltransferase involved in cell wall biosynthesis
MTSNHGHAQVDRVCVVIPAYGRTPHLATILAAIERGTLVPARIIVSHSGPGEISPDFRNRFRRVTFLHSDARLYAGAARNRGAAAAEEPILAFCDSDVLPAPDWLERLVEFLRLSGQRFVVGSVGVASTGGYWGTSNWLCEFSEQAPWRVCGEQTGGASCNMAVYRAHFDQVQGFPEHYRAGQDTLFFHSLRRQGLEQWFVPSATVGHFNIAGLANMVRHQWLHGRAFVQLRREVRLPGWRIVRSRWLTPLLPPAKIIRIASRLLEGSPRQWAMIVKYLPGVALGMACWGAGVLKEVLSTPARPSDHATGR